MSSRVNIPDLKKLMDKRLLLQLNNNRKVTGTLKGFDPFMNLVIEDCVEERSQEERIPLGTTMIRGNSIEMVEALERV